ncbi:MAG: B12-binding domain-containing radical SAM protein [Anaerolineales bacterium]|nr:MAG: B12-binding domain-containing radical SAM protein [Anaerolineales bacterium]
MSKVVLISLDREIMCIGVRLLSACLRQAGHETRMIFLPLRGSRRQNGASCPNYPQVVLDDIVELCQDADLVGLSLMTNQFLRAVAVTEHLKRELTVPVIWGGVHPTVSPEGCLAYTDIVCIGEGEGALIELADRLVKGESYHDLQNLCFISGRKIVRNEVRPLIQDLDGVPFPDYSCQDHFFLDETVKRVRALDREALVNFSGERYRPTPDSRGLWYPIMTSRGCPYSCTYCCNSAYRQIYAGQRYLRWRSTENVVAELAEIRETVAPIDFVFFVDDNFTARSERKLEGFCALYWEEIGLPFFCQCSPLTISEAKMQALLDAGCYKIAMGVETASERVAEMYNRSHFHRQLRSAIACVERFRAQMPSSPAYQFIIDNPYETIEETIQTLELLLELPRPGDNPVFSLMLFPGTELYRQARKDGYLVNVMEQVYKKDWHKHSQPFFQLWLYLYKANLPTPLLRLLLNESLARLAEGKRVRMWLSKVLDFLMASFNSGRGCLIHLYRLWPLGRERI